MATCPKCHGALTDNHKCPGGLPSRLVKALVTVVLGAVVGGLGVYLIEDHPANALVLASSALGSVLATAMRQALKS